MAEFETNAAAAATLSAPSTTPILLSSNNSSNSLLDLLDVDLTPGPSAPAVPPPTLSFSSFSTFSQGQQQQQLRSPISAPASVSAAGSWTPPGFPRPELSSWGNSSSQSQPTLSFPTNNIPWPNNPVKTGPPAVPSRQIPTDSWMPKGIPVPGGVFGVANPFGGPGAPAPMAMATTSSSASMPRRPPPPTPSANPFHAQNNTPKPSINQIREKQQLLTKARAKSIDFSENFVPAGQTQQPDPMEPLRAQNDPWAPLQPQPTSTVSSTLTQSIFD